MCNPTSNLSRNDAMTEKLGVPPQFESGINTGIRGCAHAFGRLPSGLPCLPLAGACFRRGVQVAASTKMIAWDYDGLGSKGSLVREWGTEGAIGRLKSVGNDRDGGIAISDALGHNVQVHERSCHDG